MSRARILVLSATHLCQNPRALKEAATLADAGHDVTLLSLSLRADFEAQDRALMSGQAFRRVTVDYISRPSSRLAGFVQRARTRLARAATAHGGPPSIQALGPAGALLRRARGLPADLLIAHTEIPLWIAQRLTAAGRRVAVDLEDWYSEDLLPADRRARPLALLREAEKFALHHARYVSVPSRSMADALRAAYGGRPPVVIRNTFPLQPPPPRARHGVPRAVWFSQMIGPGRGLEPFLATWARMRTPGEIHLVGAIRPAYRRTLLQLLPPARAGTVRFHEPVPPAELPARLAEYDLGLALEADQPPSRDTTITNKILQYLNAGLALVATPTAGQREVLAAAPDAGVLLDPAQPSAAGELETVFSSPGRRAAMQSAARAAAEREFCWEKDAPRLVAAVDAALRDP